MICRGPTMHGPDLDCLLERWEKAYEQGCDLPAEMLCADRPDILDQVRKAISVRRRQHLATRSVPATPEGTTLVRASEAAGANPATPPDQLARPQTTVAPE